MRDPDILVGADVVVEVEVGAVAVDAAAVVVGAAAASKLVVDDCAGPPDDLEVAIDRAAVVGEDGAAAAGDAGGALVVVSCGIVADLDLSDSVDQPVLVLRYYGDGDVHVGCALWSVREDHYRNSQEEG